VKAFILYCLFSSFLLLAALALKNLPDNMKGFAIAGLLTAVEVVFIWRILRAHK